MGSVKWGLALGWLPLTLGLTWSSIPLGLAEAYACTPVDPNAPQPPTGWTWLRPSMMSLTERTSVPVGTDGFFVIDAEGSELSAEDAEASMTIEVRDAAGEVVAGTARLLKEKQPGWYLFGWEADQRINVGATLTATLKATSPVAGDAANIGGDFALVVAGEPAGKPRPTVSISWVGYFEGQGSSVTCAADPNASSCGGPDHVEVPGAFVERKAAQVLWVPEEPNVGVAWEAEVQASPSDTEVKLPGLLTDYVVDDPLSRAGEPVARDLGLVVFRTPAEGHWVHIVTRDLRTGEETIGQTYAALEPVTRFETDSPEVYQCLAPPSDDAAVAWCRLQGENAPPRCVAILSGVDDDPPETDGGAGAPTSNPAGDAGASTNPVSRRQSRTSEGCQISAGSAPLTYGACVAAVGALLGLRRRRR